MNSGGVLAGVGLKPVNLGLLDVLVALRQEVTRVGLALVLLEGGVICVQLEEDPLVGCALDCLAGVDQRAGLMRPDSRRCLLHQRVKRLTRAVAQREANKKCKVSHLVLLVVALSLADSENSY